MRLTEAAGIGSVTDLEALAQELVAGDAGEAALGQRIARMTAQFDFDGLTDMAGGWPARGARPVFVTESTDAGLRLPPTATILVVDDSPMNLQVLVRTLQSSGHRILAARSGRAAIDIADAGQAGPHAARRDDAGHGRLRGVPPAEVASRTRATPW